VTWWRKLGCGVLTGFGQGRFCVASAPELAAVHISYGDGVPSGIFYVWSTRSYSRPPLLNIGPQRGHYNTCYSIQYCESPWIGHIVNDGRIQDGVIGFVTHEDTALTPEYPHILQIQRNLIATPNSSPGVYLTLKPNAWSASVSASVSSIANYRLRKSCYDYPRPGCDASSSCVRVRGCYHHGYYQDGCYRGTTHSVLQMNRHMKSCGAKTRDASR
jgi:hypothetical protein